MDREQVASFYFGNRDNASEWECAILEDGNIAFRRVDDADWKYTSYFEEVLSMEFMHDLIKYTEELSPVCQDELDEL